jgi:hypothetical protein
MKMKAIEDGKRVSGRQLLKAIDEHFKLTEADGAIFDMEHLLNVTMKNDSLEKFVDDWDAVMTGMRKPPEDQVLMAMFLRQMKQCSIMKEDIRDFERLVMDDPRRTYAELYRTAKRTLERRRLQTHRDQMAKHISGGNVAAAGKGGRGEQSPADDPDDENRNRKKGGKGKGGSASSGKGQGPKTEICRPRLKGKRRLGQACPKKHHPPCNTSN